MNGFEPNALRAFVAGQRLAAERSRSAKEREVPSPAECFERAMELWEIDPAAFDLPRTRSEQAGIEQVRATWRALRRADWGR